jgi:flagellar P-ring protein precursor FlgI
LKLKALLILLLISQTLFATKVKDISSVIGVRDNQLIGYGLVVGLNGTGDGSSSEFTRQAISSMLGSVNVKVDSRKVKSKNVAAVIVTAKLPAFSRHGDMLDVEVSSIGDAKSIVGGTLVMTPLKAVDGEVYALAQGSIDRGFSVNGKNSKKSTVAKIFEGALVEREVNFDISNKSSIRLSLKRSDFSTATNIQNDLNRKFRTGVARALDSRTIELVKPLNLSMVEFLAKVNETSIGNYHGADKVVIDQRTGTVVAGLNVAVEPVMVTHGDLTLKIMPTRSLPQSDANNYQYGDETSISVNNNIIRMKEGEVTVANIARVLQKLGAKPSDIIAVMQTIKRAGGINAELELI